MPSWDRPQSREDTRASAHADTAAPTPPPLQALPPFPRDINGITAAPGGETLNSTKSVSWSPHRHSLLFASETPKANPRPQLHNHNYNGRALHPSARPPPRALPAPR